MGASTTIREVEIDQGSVSYESDMTMGALADLMDAGNEGDITALSAAMAGFITAWPFTGKPSDKKAWRGLKRSEFNALTQAVMKDLGEQGNE